VTALTRHMSIERPSILTEDRKPAWRAACWRFTESAFLTSRLRTAFRIYPTTSVLDGKTRTSTHARLAYIILNKAYEQTLSKSASTTTTTSTGR